MTGSRRHYFDASPARWRRRVDRWRRRLWRIATAIVVLVAVYVVVAREVMVLVADARPQLEALLSDRLQRPVTIAALEGRMDGLSPVIEMRGLQVEPLDQGVPPLRLARSEVMLDVLPTLIHRQLRLRQLLVEGLRLGLVRQEDGRVALQGLEALTTSGQRSDPRPLLQLLYRQKRLVVNELDLTLEWPGVPALRFPDVEMAMMSSGESHLFSLRGAVPDQPLEVDVRLHMDQDAFQLSDVTGDGYARVQGAALAPWLNLALTNKPLQIERVGGEVEAWASVRAGQLSDARVRLGVAALDLQSERLSDPVRLDRADLLVGARRLPGGYRLRLVSGELQDGYGITTLPEVAVNWQDPVEDGSRAWEMQVRNLGVAVLRDWVDRQPVIWSETQAAGIERLRALAPAGWVSVLSVHGQDTGVEGFAARFSDLSMNAVDKIPGVSGASGWVAGSPQQGVVMLDSPALVVDLPRLYETPLAGEVRGPLAWARQEQGLDLSTGWLTVDNPDASGRAVARVRLRDGRLPNLSLLASLTRGNGDNVSSYIPLKRLPEGAAGWLREAFAGGSVPEGRFLHEGPVRIDPNRQQDRTLQMAFRVAGVGLNYLPGWPAMDSLAGDIYLDGRAIRGRGISGNLAGTRLTQVVADIPEYEGDAVPTLVVSGRTAGPAADVSRLLTETPLAEALPQEMARWALTGGEVKGHLLLHWPLPADAPGKMFIADAKLDRVTLAAESRGLRFDGLNGPLFFHLDRGLFSSGLSGEFWGGPMTAIAQTEGGRLAVSGSGEAQVAQALDWISDRLDGLAQGGFAYNSTLVLPWRQDGEASLSLASNLDGVSVAMPEPMAKAAEETRRLSARIVLDEQPRVSLTVDDWLRAAILPGEDGLKGASVTIGGGTPAWIEDRIRLSGRLQSLSVEPWMDWLDNRPDGDGSLPPMEADLQVTRLDLLDFPVTAARLGVSEPEGGWKFSLESAELAGEMDLPDDFSLRGNRPMAVRVSRLEINDSEESGQALDPMLLPVADLDLNGLMVDGENFGRWKMKLRPEANGLRIEDLDARWRSTVFTGDASWLKDDEGERTHFTGRAFSPDLAAALRAWDVPTVIESKRANAILDLSWQGSPLELDYLATRGTVSVHVKDALIPNSDSRTNALRMLGIFNVNAVSRRLRLDFSDVYKRGLSCDEISGDFEVEGPLVTTRNLVLDSPSAEFRISGTTNLDTELLDQRVDVTLPTSSSLYLGCFAGPATCAGIFVVERLWGNKLEKMLSLTYSVTGSWSDPKVKEMERKK